jgi:manganese efflux pump family protein
LQGPDRLEVELSGGLESGRLAFVLPLGLDSFAVAAAIGASRATAARERARISLIFVTFEGGMPLIGLGLGSALARGIGSIADYLAATTVIAVGGWMLLSEEGEEDKASKVSSSRGLELVALGISISMDELAVGFSIGLTHLPVSAVIIAIAVQAFAAAQIGLAIGARIGERWRKAPNGSPAPPSSCSAATLSPPGSSANAHTGNRPQTGRMCNRQPGFG